MRFSWDFSCVWTKIVRKCCVFIFGLFQCHTKYTSTTTLLCLFKLFFCKVNKMFLFYLQRKKDGIYLLFTIIALGEQPRIVEFECRDVHSDQTVNIIKPFVNFFLILLISKNQTRLNKLTVVFWFGSGHKLFLMKQPATKK